MDGLTFNPFSSPLFSVCEIGESFGASSYKCMIIVTSMKCVCMCGEREREREREITTSFRDRLNTLDIFLFLFLSIATCRI